MNEIKLTRIDSLTCWRFVMMLMIVTCHLEYLKSSDTDFYMQHLHNPNMAVDFFFVMSGFGLTWNSYRKGYLPSMNLAKAIRFGYSKVKKIYYLYFIVIMHGFIWMEYGRQFTTGYTIEKIIGDLGKLAISLPMLQSITGMKVLSEVFCGLCWFISTLLFLYIAYPYLQKLNNKYCNTVSQSYKCFIAVLGLAFFSHILFTKIATSTPFDDLNYGSPFFRIWHFIAGILLCNIIVKSKNGGGGKIECFCIIAVFLWYFFRNDDLLIDLNISIKVLVDLVMACAIVFVFAPQSGCVSKWMSTNKSFVLLGNVSMYIYLIHGFGWIISIVFKDYFINEVVYKVITTFSIMLVIIIGTFICHKYDNIKSR